MRAPRLARRAASVGRTGNVVMFHVGRSGSSVLCGMLNQRPEIFWDGEVYRRANDEWSGHAWRPWSSRAPVEPVAHLRNRMVLAGRRYYGLEVKFNHLRQIRLTPEEFVSHLDGLRFTHFIVLRRTNLLRVLVSYAVARQHDAFHGGSDRAPQLRPVTIEVERTGADGSVTTILDRLQQHERDLVGIGEILHGRNVLELAYESDIEPDPLIGYRRVCDFAGLEPRDVVVELSRLNPFPLHEIVVNHHQVRDALAGTQYSWMLEG